LDLRLKWQEGISGIILVLEEEKQEKEFGRKGFTLIFFKATFLTQGLGPRGVFYPREKGPLGGLYTGVQRG